jgi:hypothetical protein
VALMESLDIAVEVLAEEEIDLEEPCLGERLKQAVTVVWLGEGSRAEAEHWTRQD